MTTSGARQKLVGVQILRGIAALMVVSHHALEEAEYSPYADDLPDWLVRCGAAGVDVFFVLSGFIMVYVTFSDGKKPDTPILFFLKRGLRIYPFYWLCCLLTLSLKSVGLFQAKVTDAETILRSLLLVPENNLLVSASWTLVYEIYFYLVFGLALLARSKAATIFVTCLVILVMNLLSPWAVDETLSKFLGNEVAFEFCFGLFVGAWCTRRVMPQRVPQPRITQPLLFSCGVLLLLLASAAFPASGTGSLDEPWRFVGWGVPATVLVGAAVLSRPKLDSLWTKLGLALGDSSYATYLTHGFIMTAYAKLMRMFPLLANRDQWLAIVGVTILSVFGGYLAHRFLELPVTSAARDYLSRTSTRRTASS